VAVNVLVCERKQPLLCMLPSFVVTVGVPHASVAVALPSAALIVADDGLHPKLKLLPVAVIVGDVTSAVHVAVRDTVAVLPQPSVAVNVLVCERKHPPLVTPPSVALTVVEPQASVAVAEPNAASMFAEVGLHPRLKVLPVAVIVGAVTSTVHVAMREVVDVFPQASVAVNVLACERKQPLLCILPSFVVTVGVPQASVADALPSAALMAAVEGLHPTLKLLPFAVIVGALTSSVQVAVLDAVVVLPHPSVAVKVLAWERAHPLDCIEPSAVVTVGVPQASVAVALPSAEFIVAVDGLHPKLKLLPVAVIVGTVTSTVHVAMREAVDVFAQASVAVNVLVCERKHPLL
jgi:hypothetical protein